MPKAVIFDVDGTLVDSVDLHARAWMDAFAAFGHTIPLAELRAQIGKGGDHLIPVFLNGPDMAKAEALEARRGEIFKTCYMAQVEPFPSVRALFERLRRDGVQIALASSAKSEELRQYERLAGIEDLVPVRTSSDDAQSSKPDPDIFQAALARLGEDVQAGDVVVVGDTPYDAEAASKAGMRSVGLTCGGWSAEALRRAGCIAVYGGPADLLAGFEDSPLARQA